LPSGFIVRGLLFLYNHTEKEGVKMGSFECEDLLLLLDDDLFPIEAEQTKESEANSVEVL
jgi:hypothetical protein